MPAGAGPNVNQTQPGALAADTVEHIICTLVPQNWNNPNQLGNLLSFAAVMAGTGAGTVTFRIRQGTTITGALVGVTVPVVVAAAGTYDPAAEFQDASAFGNLQQNGQYVLTYQQSVASIASISNAILELETIATVS